MPKETPGVFPHESLEGVARKVIGFHFNQMLLNEGGTIIGDDSEHLHDMRVAIRRMRVAIQVFGVKFEWKGLNKGLRNTGRSLGTVRDFDVFLEKIQIYFDALPEAEVHELSSLLLTWSMLRNKSRRKMLVYLGGKKYSSMKSGLVSYLEGPNNANKAKTSIISHLAMPMIDSHFGDVMKLGENLINPSWSHLHKLRIAFKKLRYTIEFFIDILDERGYILCIDLLKQIQDCLGEINDANVTMAFLGAFLEEWPKELNTHHKKIVLDYLSVKQEELLRLMDAFPEFWAEFIESRSVHQLTIQDI